MGRLMLYASVESRSDEMRVMLTRTADVSNLFSGLLLPYQYSHRQRSWQSAMAGLHDLIFPSAQHPETTNDLSFEVVHT